MTGRLYESSCEVFELVVECMEDPISQKSTQEDCVDTENGKLSSLTLP